MPATGTVPTSAHHFLGSTHLLAARPLESGPSAQMYGSLAAVLAGFAFAGLVLYLERQKPGDDQRSGTTESRQYSHIKPASIAKTLFYAMSALTICAFLYGRLAGETEASGWTFLGLALYGLVLAPAVLSLFYALNLVMVTHEVTRSTAESTRWVVTAVGPAVVISLLTDLLANAWTYGCRSECAGWTSPRWWGFALALVFGAFGLFTTLPTPRTLAHVGRPVRWILRRRSVQRAAGVFRSNPQLPAFITLSLASVTGVVSLWARSIPDGSNPRYWAHGVLAGSALVMGVFAFAAGSVLDVPLDLETTTTVDPDAEPTHDNDQDPDG